MYATKTVVTSCAQSNCYLVMDPETKEGFVVDPGDDAKRIIREMENFGIQPKAILMTHGHFDHILAADEIKAHYGIPTCIGENDSGMAKDARLNGGGFLPDPRGMEADRKLRDGEVLQLFTPVRVIETPGHTAGGVCFYLPEEGILFTGDTLFLETVGRTDLYGGSFKNLLSSVREKLCTLPEETRVYPGHGFPTTIGHEKYFNPFLNQID